MSLRGLNKQEVKVSTIIGINGFGRIGRLTFRAIKQYHKGQLSVAAVNDLTDTETNAHLLRRDSSYGKYPGEVEARENSIVADGEDSLEGTGRRHSD
jgi:glyceraldehyde 3-phosphate dehydrogenase